MESRQPGLMVNTLMLNKFIRYTIIWISQNLAIPFWTVGHIHLMTTVYEDIIELVSSIGMNIIVALGFWWDYNRSYKSQKHE
jgi:hypothetical protein